jgi:exonuclease III
MILLHPHQMLNSIGNCTVLHWSVNHARRICTKNLKKGITNWEAVNENIITANIKHLGFKITVLCVYAPSNDKADLEKDQFYEKLKETLINIGTTREIILIPN